MAHIFSFLYRLLVMSASLLFMQVMFLTLISGSFGIIANIFLVLAFYFAGVAFYVHLRGLNDPFSAGIVNSRGNRQADKKPA